ncbi:MAG: carbohydrate kinase, partial [Sphaerochaeta sp.]|nr:carbohydrate kinase [Sphaerochaeta sp.]
RNDHVNQMTADLTKKRVVSGPEEATSLGIIAMQIMRDFPHYTIADLRSIIRESVPLGVFTPKE